MKFYLMINLTRNAERFNIGTKDILAAIEAGYCMPRIKDLGISYIGATIKIPLIKALSYSCFDNQNRVIINIDATAYLQRTYQVSEDGSEVTIANIINTKLVLKDLDIILAEHLKQPILPKVEDTDLYSQNQTSKV